MEYPYQLVAFFDKEPAIGEFVYEGENGWYPQIALKRRFAFNDLSEEQGLSRLQEYVASVVPFEVNFGQRLQPAHMPVEVIEVVDSPQVVSFHRDFIRYMGKSIVSKFPEREDENYYPHMTITWNGEEVVETTKFVNQRKPVTKIWVIKEDGQDSRAFKVIELGKNLE